MGKWIYMIIVRDGKQVKTYVNGRLVKKERLRGARCTMITLG
jgi:hypothetical protein